MVFHEGLHQMTIRTCAAIATLLLLGACNGQQPAPTAAQHIDSGINANNGGGMNSTGGLINEGVTTRTAPMR